MAKHITAPLAKYHPAILAACLYARDCADWWVYNQDADPNFFSQLFAASGQKLPLLDILKQLEVWLLDNPPERGKRMNVRLRFTRFCKNHLKWAEPEYQTARADKIEAAKPKPQRTQKEINSLINGSGKASRPRTKPAPHKKPIRKASSQLPKQHPSLSQEELERRRQKQLAAYRESKTTNRR